MDPALDDVESPAKVTNKCGPGTSLAPSSPPGLVEPLLSEAVVKKNNKYRLLLEAALWHLPQRLAATCLYRLSGARIYEPLATIIDSRIAIGTSPLSTSDILELSTKYRVGSVLEICSPFSCLSLGQSAYSAHVGPRDVVQAHERVGLSCEDLRVATSSIRRRIDDEPHKRCFIACNDGSRFAPVVAAAFICVSQRCELGQAVDLLERRLPEDKSINFHRIRTDPALRALSDKINDEKDLDGWALVDKGDFLP